MGQPHPLLKSESAPLDVLSPEIREENPNTDPVILFLESEIEEQVFGGLLSDVTCWHFKDVVREPGDQLYSGVCCQPKGGITVLPGIWDQLIPRASPNEYPSQRNGVALPGPQFPYLPTRRMGLMTGDPFRANIWDSNSPLPKCGQKHPIQGYPSHPWVFPVPINGVDTPSM